MHGQLSKKHHEIVISLLPKQGDIRSTGWVSLTELSKRSVPFIAGAIGERRRIVVSVHVLVVLGQVRGWKSHGSQA